ncbi:hypothetical protein GHT06_020153 [Daphnia sinensis]|uniref:Uncharacterized protein n=1 Tax=Daphnia sinensis TaxID=1820382 RepID=A0AAD5L2M2_9CRUS|nr:hypothetical protein GHT06_020153 [Daphnia sinensis]
MEHQFLDIFFVYFLGTFLLFGLKWMLNSIPNIFLPHPESLPAPNKIQPERKLPLSPTKEGASCLQKHGFLPGGNKSMNNPDEITNERQATLMTTELERIKLLQELVKNTEKKLLQLKAVFDVEKFALMQAVHTWKPCAHADQKSNLKQDKQLESAAEGAKYELEKLKETFSKEMAELKALMVDEQAALKLAEERQRELGDMFGKATEEANALRTEMSHALANQKALYEEREKQLALVAEQAKRQLIEVRQTTQEEITELKVANHTNEAAMNLAKGRQRELEDMLGKAMQEAEAIRTEMSHALANQEALYEEREKQLKLVAEQATCQLKEVRKTNQEQVIELKVANHTKEAALKFAEERQRELGDMFGKATEEANALRTEMSHALANQEALYEEREKQLALVAEQAKRQLRELLEARQTIQEEVMELKVSNRVKEEALKSAEEKMKEMEEISLKRAKAAESLANEQTAALTEAISALQVAVKHAKDEVLDDSSSSNVEEKPVGKNETLEQWLIKNGFLTRIPPKTWMELLEHTGFLMEEKLNNLKSKAEMLFHSNKTTPKTE